MTELAAVTDSDAVALAISRSLRLAVNPGRPVLEALLDVLAPQDALIVVDNCEHLIGGCAGLPSIPGVMTLGTADLRRPLS